MSPLFASGGQSIGASASASVLPMNIQDWFPLGLTGLISLQSKGPSRVFSSTTVQSINPSALSLPCFYYELQVCWLSWWPGVWPGPRTYFTIGHLKSNQELPWCPAFRVWGCWCGHQGFIGAHCPRGRGGNLNRGVHWSPMKWARPLRRSYPGWQYTKCVVHPC